MKKLLALLGTIALASTTVVSTVGCSNNDNSNKSSDLEKQLKEAMDLIKNLKAQIQIKEKQIKDLEVDKNELQSQLKVTKEAFEKEQKKVTELKNQLADKIKLIQQLHDKEKLLQDKLNEEIAKNNSLNEQIKQLNKLVEQKDSEIVTKNETINQLSKEKKLLQEQLEKEIAENGRLTEQTKKLQESIDKLNEEIVNDKESIDHLKHENFSLQEKLNNEIAKNNSLNDEIKQLNLKIEKLNNQIFGLKDELKTVKANLEKETKAFNDLKSDFQKLEDKYSDLEIERDNLQDQLKEQNEKLKKIEEENEKLRRENDEILLNWADYMFSNELIKKFDGMQVNDNISEFLDNIKSQIPKIWDNIIEKMSKYDLKAELNAITHIEPNKNKVIVEYVIKGNTKLTKTVELNYKSELQTIIDNVKKEKKGSDEYYNAYKNYLSYLFSRIEKQSEKNPLVFDTKHPNDDRLIEDFMQFFDDYYHDIIKSDWDKFGLPEEEIVSQFDWQYFAVDEKNHVIIIKDARILLGSAIEGMQKATFTIKKLTIHYNVVK